MLKLIKYLKGSKRYMITAIILNLAFASINIIYTDVFRRYFNDVQGGNTNKLIEFVIALVSLELIMTITHYISSYLSSILQRRTNKNMQKSVFNRMLKAITVDIDKQPTGELVALLSNDVSVASDGISSVSIRIFHLVTTFLVNVSYLIWLNWQMALITLTIGPLMLLLGMLFSKKIEKSADAQRDSEAKRESMLISAINSLSFIKLNHLQRFIIKKYNTVWDKSDKSTDKSNRIGILYDELSSFLGVVGSILILGVAAILLANGQLMLGTVVAYLQLHNEIVWPFIEMSSLWRHIITSKVSVDRVEKILSIPFETENNDIKITNLEKVETKNLSFSYDGETNTLSDVNFVAKKGEITCLLGENGAGKSTLLKILCGLYLPSSGDVLVGDIKLQNDTMESIRLSYSFVMQHEQVFDGTILENLLFDKTISLDEVKKSAKLTGFDSYVNELKDGYNTVLTNANLSGGELKKLSLTRMLLSNKPIIILDEPFSHLDVSSCAMLEKLLLNMKKDKIIILVTHEKEVPVYADFVFKL